jgi:phosphohistidine phosphatase
MKLIIMRHGEAEEAAASRNDFDRALTKKGRKKVRSVGRTLRQELQIPELIIASPLVRALQTAEIVAAELDPNEPVIVRQEIAPDGDPMLLLRELVLSDIESAMLVGHEPALSDMVRALLPHEWTKNLTKAMAVALRVDRGASAKLQWVLDPRRLELALER